MFGVSEHHLCQLISNRVHATRRDTPPSYIIQRNAQRGVKADEPFGEEKKACTAKTVPKTCSATRRSGIGRRH
jgi:hypothetical protein